MYPNVSAVIPTYNGEKTVEKSILSLLKQDYPMLNIMIIDDGSTDKTLSILEKYNRNIKIIKNEENLGLSKTLNKGIKLAGDGEFLFILHDDCELVGNCWISSAIRHFSNEKVGAVCGEFCVPDPSQLRLAQKIFLVLNNEIFFERDVKKVPFSLLKADLFRLDALRKVGGFSSPGNSKFGMEDQIMGSKFKNTGHLILKDPSLKVYTHVGSRQDTFDRLLKKEYLYGKSTAWALINKLAEVNAGESQQFKRKIRYRQLKLASVTLSTICLITSLVWQPLLFVIPLIQLIQFVRYFLIAKNNLYFKLRDKEKLLFAGVGVISDWIYSYSFYYGAIMGTLHGLRKTLVS